MWLIDDLLALWVCLLPYFELAAGKKDRLSIGDSTSWCGAEEGVVSDVVKTTWRVN